MSRNTDWLDRFTIPDVYPRSEDPYNPGAAFTPAGVTAVPEAPVDPLTISLTTPGQRPTVYQRAIPFTFGVTATPQPIVATRLEVDAITISNLNANLNTVVFGYGNSITTVSGTEIVPGQTQTFSPSNNRELWELQRVFEYMAAIMALQSGIGALPTYKAPRVVMDASSYFLVSSAPTTVSIQLWFVPEQQ